MLIYFTSGNRAHPEQVAVNAALVRAVMRRGEYTAIAFDKEHLVIVLEQFDDVCSSLAHALSG